MPKDLSRHLAVIVPIAPEQSRNPQAAAPVGTPPPDEPADDVMPADPHRPRVNRAGTALRVAIALVALNWIALGLSWWGPSAVRSIAGDGTVVLGVYWFRRRGRA